MNITRRRFLQASAAVTLGFIGVRTYLSASASPLRGKGYGDLLPDPNSLKILELPKGFTYRVFSQAGERMDDGFFVPGNHDGMAAFPGPNGKTILIRNHEVSPETESGPFGVRNELLRRIDRTRVYDGRGTMPGLGGTTTLVYDTRKKKLDRHFLSLAGTSKNCAGAPTPWNSWISCEETVDRAGAGFEKDHGYAFEVPANASIGLVDPLPLKAMGRFQHEAAAVDPRSGVVYETEDQKEGLIYRFIPNVPGQLARGGRLQALRIRDQHGADTTNHGAVARIAVGQSFATDWIDLEDVESARNDLRFQGHAKGAAIFTRAEGMCYCNGAVYFAPTDGGPAGAGQIWRYIPSPDEGTTAERNRPGRLELFIEPNDPSLLENPDNLTVAPWGDLILCQDSDGEDLVFGLTPTGKLYRLARNVLNDSEFAGATFSPDGSTLFVNILGPGLTLAITSASEKFPKPPPESAAAPPE